MREKMGNNITKIQRAIILHYLGERFIGLGHAETFKVKSLCFVLSTKKQHLVGFLSFEESS